MNKRQAKKQFKKLYGCNPNQLAKGLDEFVKHIPNTVDILCKGIADFMKQCAEYIQSDEFKQVYSKVVEYSQEHNITIEQAIEELKGEQNDIS